MIVISLTDCPPKVRGDLSKWLCELNTGVYVGKVSARVRDELWERICDSIRSGRATMVYTVNNEQGYDFRTHNSTWQPVDLDGIKLMLHPAASAAASDMQPPDGFSKAAQRLKAARISAARQRKAATDEYVVIDTETNGLDPRRSELIEIAALRVRDGIPGESWSALINIGEPIDQEITRLTGITDAMCHSEGLPADEAIRQFCAFVGDSRVVCHNASFDYGFIRVICDKYGLPPFSNRCEDTLQMARRKIFEVEDYKLSTLALFYGLDSSKAHRALPDCRLTAAIYEKLRSDRK